MHAGIKKIIQTVIEFDRKESRSWRLLRARTLAMTGFFIKQ
jgi:hypothetical protein